MARCKYRKAYAQHKSNAKRRGLEMRMSLDEWRDVWMQSGFWEQRGRGAEKYCMCRKNDEGHYEIGNVFIGLGRDNVSQGNLGKPDSAETKLKKSIALSGLSKPWCRGDKNPMHRPEVKAKISAAIGGANNYKAKRVLSPHGEYGSTTEAAKDLDIPAVTIQWRCRHNRLGWSYA